MSQRQENKARAAVGIAVRSGRLTKPKLCESCNDQAELEGHHTDYNQPLLVRWLCKSCHADEHSKLDQPEGLTHFATTWSGPSFKCGEERTQETMSNYSTTYKKINCPMCLEYLYGVRRKEMMEIGEKLSRVSDAWSNYEPTGIISPSQV